MHYGLVAHKQTAGTRLYSEIHDSWRRIAGRDGAITLFHFRRTIGGIFGALKKCPTVGALTNRVALKEGFNTFEAKFPNIVAIRHGVAHMADLAAKPDEFLKHAFSGDYEGPPPRGFNLRGLKDTMVADVLQGNMFTTTWRRRILSYEVSATSANHVTEAMQRLWDAFEEPTIILSLTPQDKAG